MSSYAILRLVDSAMKSGGLPAVLKLAVLGLSLCALVWCAKRYARYLDYKAEEESRLREQILSMHKEQAKQANAYTSRMVDAFVAQVDSDQRFQAKTIEAMSGLSDSMKRVENGNGGIKMDLNAVHLKITEIRSWLNGHNA